MRSVHDTALITGASSGLGEEFARLWAQAGSDVVLVARDKERLDALAKDLRRAHKVTVTVLPCDLSKEGACDDLAKQLTRKKITVTTLVNNAGFGGFGAFAKTDLATEKQMIDLNIKALTELTKHLLPDMLKRKKGRILNVASTAAYQPGPLMAVYYATKAYVLSLSLALSVELQGTGVTVTCLSPGPTRTRFAANAKMDRSKLFRGHVMDAKPVALAGFKGCVKGKAHVIPGKRNRLGVLGTRLVSRTFAAKVAKWMQNHE